MLGKEFIAKNNGKICRPDSSADRGMRETEKVLKASWMLRAACNPDVAILIMLATLCSEVKCQNTYTKLYAWMFLF